MTWTKVDPDHMSLIPVDDYLLVVIEFNEPHRKPAIRMAYYDPYDKGWRTMMGRIPGHWVVTHWQRLPEMPEEGQ